MIETLIVEKALLEHPIIQRLRARFPEKPFVVCDHYGELFNRKNQNFRLQKAHPSLILAEKQGKCVLPTPEGYGIGAQHNYYFSHMLNCVYDCRYCFLQGMYRSANYLLFVNFETFQRAMEEKLVEHEGEKVTFFSGYDCDSLALEGLTEFAQHFLPFIARHPQAELELRTKSTAIHPFLRQEVVPNVVLAFTLTPEEVVNTFEHRTPRLSRRLKALKRLQDAGWTVGIRFDPLIYCENFKDVYHSFFETVFREVSGTRLHSVSMGPLRFPKGVHKTMVKLYPEEPLLAIGLEDRGGLISYSHENEKALLGFCETQILRHVPKECFFPCT